MSRHCLLAFVTNKPREWESNLCVFPGQVFRNVSAEFETDASAQNHFPGRSDAAHTCQTSSTEPQAGARHAAGKHGSRFTEVR